MFPFNPPVVKHLADVRAAQHLSSRSEGYHAAPVNPKFVYPMETPWGLLERVHGIPFSNAEMENLNTFSRARMAFHSLGMRVLCDTWRSENAGSFGRRFVREIRKCESLRNSGVFRTNPILVRTGWIFRLQLCGT